MRCLARTEAKGAIVELTSAEWKALAVLSEKMNGMEYKGGTLLLPMDFGDMDPALQAVAAWLDTSFTTQQLQDVVNSLKRSLVPPKLRERLDRQEADS